MSPRPGRRRPALALLGLALLAPALGIAPVTPADAAPPRRPVVLFTETFENLGLQPTQPRSLTAHVGESPSPRYTADRAWLTYCNGTIVVPPGENDNAPHQVSNGCVPLAYANAVQLNEGLSRLGAVSDGDGNNSLVGRTDEPGRGHDPGAGKVQIETVGQVPIDRLTNRFLSVGVLTAAMNCGRTGYRPAQLDLRLKTGATGSTLSHDLGNQLDVCATPLEATIAPRLGRFGPTSAPLAVRLGTRYASSGYLFSGTRVGFQIVNQEASGTGNDVALDEISVLDVTPRLAVSFSPGEVSVGGTTNLELQALNTSDLGEKAGFAYTVTLPPGLVLADPVEADSLCFDRVMTGVVPGATRFTLKATLAGGTVACPIRLNVKATSTGTKTLSAASISARVGIDPPTAISLVVR